MYGGGGNEECYTALLFPRQIHGPRFCNALQTDGDGILSVSMYGFSTIYHYYSCGFLSPLLPSSFRLDPTVLLISAALSHSDILLWVSLRVLSCSLLLVNTTLISIQRASIHSIQRSGLNHHLMQLVMTSSGVWTVLKSSKKTGRSILHLWRPKTIPTLSFLPTKHFTYTLCPPSRNSRAKHRVVTKKIAVQRLQVTQNFGVHAIFNPRASEKTLKYNHPWETSPSCKITEQTQWLSTTKTCIHTVFLFHHHLSFTWSSFRFCSAYELDIALINALRNGR